MEQDNNYQERSLEELRNDINSKVEWISKEYLTDKKIMLWFVAVFAVFEGLNLCFDWFPHHLLIFAAFSVFILAMIAIGLLGDRMTKTVTRATDVKQHFKAVKRFFRFYQLTMIISFLLGFLFMGVIIDGPDWWTNDANIGAPIGVMVIGLIWICFKPKAFIDRGLCDDVDELEDYVVK